MAVVVAYHCTNYSDIHYSLLFQNIAEDMRGQLFDSIFNLFQNIMLALKHVFIFALVTLDFLWVF